ncbi:hypothetical protein MMC25_005574 [Agyrium rufum]|nr:hypothetical protein [Agyrium rufum]
MEVPSSTSGGHPRGISKPYRSYRKKYRKIRCQFEDTLRTSNVLFGEEQKAQRISRRLQEENDQLLEILLCLNDSPTTPARLKYNTDPEAAKGDPDDDGPPTPAGLDSKNLDHFDAQTMILKARHQAHKTGRQEGWEQWEDDVLNSVTRPQELHKLVSRTSHTPFESVPDVQLPFDLGHQSPTGFLSTVHEDEYLDALDTAIESSEFLGTSDVSAWNQVLENRDKEKDLALHNPNSTYNWLRENLPHYFLEQAMETPVEKLPPKVAAPPKPPKRHSIKPEPELLDDEGFVIGAALDSNPKGKRKRDDDAYRPKGGSSRSSRKKRTSTSQGERRKTIEEDGL